MSTLEYLDVEETIFYDNYENESIEDFKYPAFGVALKRLGLMDPAAIGLSTKGSVFRLLF